MAGTVKQGDGTELPEGFEPGDAGNTYTRTNADGNLSFFHKRTNGSDTGWQQIKTSEFMNILGDRSDETSKFSGKEGTLESNGRNVTVTQIPSRVRSMDTYWRKENADDPEHPGANTMWGSYPASRAMLPVALSRLIPPLAYYTWAEDGCHLIDGEARSMIHFRYGGHGSDPVAVILAKENLASGSVTHELLWRPDASSPNGYNCASSFSMGHTEFALVTTATPIAWKMYRRNIGHTIDGRDCISTVGSNGYARFVKSKFPWRAFIGLKFFFQSFGTDAGASTLSIGGLELKLGEANMYVVTGVTNTQVLFAPADTGVFSPPAASTVTGGGYFFLRAPETGWAEVLFADAAGVAKSWGEALITFPGETSQPGYVIGGGVDTRINNRGIAAVGSGTIYLMDQLLHAGTASNPANFKQICKTPTRPSSSTQAAGGGPSYAFYDNGTTDGVWFCTFGPRTYSSSAPVVAFSTNAFASEPKYVQLPTASSQCRVPTFVTKDYGKGARLQLVAPTRRDKGGWYSQMDVFLWDVGAKQFLDTATDTEKTPTEAAAAAAKLFERYLIHKVDYYKHQGVDPDTVSADNQGPAANGMASICELPGGGGLYIPMGFQTPRQERSANSLVGHMALKVDTRALTGCPNEPVLVPGDIQHPVTHVARFVDILPTGAEKNLRFRNPQYDWTLGDYSNNALRSRVHGHYRMRFCIPLTAHATLDSYVTLIDVGTGVAYADLYGYKSEQNTAFLKSGSGTQMVYGELEFRLAPDQSVIPRVVNGTIGTPTALQTSLTYLVIERLG